MKKLSILLLILLSFGLLSCELSVGTDESVLMAELAGIDARLDGLDVQLAELELLVDANHEEFLESYQNVAWALMYLWGEIQELDQDLDSTNDRISDLNKKFNKFERKTNKRIEKLCDRIYDNDDDIRDLQNQVSDLWDASEDVWLELIRLADKDQNLLYQIRTLRQALDAHKLDSIFFAHPFI